MKSTDWDHEDNATCLTLCIPIDCCHKVRLASDLGQSPFITSTGSHTKRLQVFQNLWQVLWAAYPPAVSSQKVVSWIVFSLFFFIFCKTPEPLATLVTATLLKTFLEQSVFSLPEDNWNIYPYDTGSPTRLCSGTTKHPLYSPWVAAVSQPAAVSCPRACCRTYLAALVACCQFSLFPESLGCHTTETWLLSRKELVQSS